MPSNQHEFAQREMSRCGWTEGKGLGRTENGMREAIKVKRKNNTNGLGHDQGTEFTFHWWDYIFNKAANSFKVSEGDGGDTLIEKCEGKKITPVLISNKKPLSSKFANASLTYGTFVKAGTYQAGNKELSDNVSDDDSSDDSSDDDDDDKILSLNDTLEKTFKKTGLTGHKAARHGFGLCGKLQRLENQEQKQVNVDVVNVDKTDLRCEVKTDLRCKDKSASKENNCDMSKSEEVISNVETYENNKVKKKKKKTKEKSLPVDPTITKSEQNDNKNGERENTEIRDQEPLIDNTKTKKKKKKKKKTLGNEDHDNSVKLKEGNLSHGNEETNDKYYSDKGKCETDESKRTEDITLKKKQKKKKRKHVEYLSEAACEPIENEITLGVKIIECKSSESNNLEVEPKKKKKKKKKYITEEV